MRIKYLFMVGLLAGLISCGGNSEQFTVIGEVSNLPEGTVLLEEVSMDGLIAIDSAQPGNGGKFELKGSAPEPRMYRLHFPNNRYILLSTGGGNIKINADYTNLERSYTVSGSASSEGLKQMITVMREHMGDMNRMQIVIDTLSRNGDTAKLQSAVASLRELNASLTRYMENYADSSKSLPNALFAAQMVNPQVEGAFLEAFAQSLESRFPDSKLAQQFIDKYDERKAQQQQTRNGLPVGVAAPEITLPTPTGKEVSLSDFRGKYVLIDFWASWCGPCRRENPNVVRAYNQYKNENFTILGVSLDNNKDKWLKAIKDDALTWTHISDLKGWQSIAARDYRVSGIPVNFLVDPEGNIIATNLREDDLTNKLNEIFSAAQ